MRKLLKKESPSFILSAFFCSDEHPEQVRPKTISILMYANQQTTTIICAKTPIITAKLKRKESPFSSSRRVSLLRRSTREAAPYKNQI